MLYGAQAPRRRDALRNREAILRAASEAMTSTRAAVGIPEIARLAGVGQATLYRHFPDRHALTDAVLDHQLQRMADCLTRLREHPRGVRMVLHEVLSAQLTMRPLVLLARRLDPAALHRHQRRFVSLFTEPLRWAQAQGHVRRDLLPDDLILLFTMVEGAVEKNTTTAGRSIDLALDTLRP